MFEYRFQMQGGLPKSSNSRPIPFSLWREVSEQIEDMVKNGILEISYSPYANPLKIIQREDKPVRICVDAWQVNTWTRTEQKHKLMNCYRDSMGRNTFLPQILTALSCRFHWKNLREYGQHLTLIVKFTSSHGFHLVFVIFSFY